MNFFKSILSEDLEPDNPHEVASPSAPIEQPRGNSGPDGVAPGGGGTVGAWGFGSLIKTLATRSESLIETYRRDIEEFGSGLKKETEIIREAASRAVKDLPASIEAGTSAAHGVLDGVLKSTAEIISDGTRDFSSDGEPEAPVTNGSSKTDRYSWFETQLSKIQNDLSTFCEEPEDVEEYKEWKSGFRLEEKRNEMDGLIGENGNLVGVFEKVVPIVVDQETFFCRYFYRVDKLKQQDRVRTDLVKRRISVDDDEEEDELTWDVDDEISDVGSTDENKRGNLNVDYGGKNDMVELKNKSGKDESMGEKEVKSNEVADVKSDKNSVEGNISANSGLEKVDSGKKNNDDLHPVKPSGQVKTVEEEDLSWDEIGDTESGDEKKILATGRPSIRANHLDRLNGEENDEDLSWDVEDDDEPVKS